MTLAALKRLARPSIGRRIRVAMLVALVLVQAQAAFQLWLFARPEIQITGVRALTDLTERVVERVFDAPPSSRADLAAAMSRIEEPSAVITWTDRAPDFAAAAQLIAEGERLSATLQARLSGRVRTIVVGETPFDYLFPLMSNVRIALNPPDLSRSLGRGALGADEPDAVAPFAARVAIQALDGTWVTIRPQSFAEKGLLRGQPLGPFALGIVLIAAGSVIAARRILAPLDKLIIAAARMGESRTPAPIDTSGLGEFAAVAEAMERAEGRMLGLVEERTQMLAALSHDLRSSLTRLSIANETAQDEEGRRLVAREAEDMRAMIEQTLAFAGGEARATPSGRVDIAALLISLVDEAADAGAAGEYQGPDHAVVYGNPTALKRAFRNLLDNAAKYAGQARVRLSATANGAEIVIEDDGPGIAPERREQALAPFGRLDPARGGAPGVGLGLTIARDVVAGHGGTMTLDASPSGGLAVRITLPARASPP